MLFIFDMGGVVTSTFTMTSITDYLGIDWKTFDNVCKGFDCNIKHQLNIGEITTKQFWNTFNQRTKEVSLGIPEVQHDLFRLFFHPTLNQQTVEIIEMLRKNNHRVVCGTNTIDSHWENHLERGDYSFFDQTYASNKIGAAKPDTLFYQLILKAENTLPENAFFVDDREENVKAAASLGINAIQFTTASDLKLQWQKYFN